MEYKITWDNIRNFETKKSLVHKSWLKDFYNTGCRRKGIKCWADFYNVIGLFFDDINPRDPKNSNKIRRLRPKEIRANPRTNMKIHDFITNQYHPTKYKGRRPSVLGMDYLQHCPYDDEAIEEDVIVIRIDSKIKWDKEVDYLEEENR